MMDERKISVCIPTWNRPELTIASFIDVYGDERISEFVIVDDYSELYNYERLKQITDNLPKVKLYRNESNKDCYVNKKISVELATNEWVIVFDSDNRLTKEYLDAIFGVRGWCDWHIYAPTFAMPTFDYRHFSGLSLNFGNINQFLSEKMSDTALNTMNFFVNRRWFIDVWDGAANPNTADSIYFNYCWLKKRGEIHFVAGMEYHHLVHDQSHYKLNNHKTNGFYEEVIEKLKALK